MKASEQLWTGATRPTKTARTSQVSQIIETLDHKLKKLFFIDPEIMETFDRANYRQQSGSSLDSNNDYKKKKNGKIFKFGMFK